MLPHALLLLVHLLAAIVWIGGMTVMHFAVRPAAVARLEPPARLGFMADALGRFFNWVTAAIVLLFASGLGMALPAGMAQLHWSVHAMLGIGCVMTAIFGVIRLSAWPRLVRAVAERQWPAGAAALARIRVLVTVNLALGVLVIALVIVGPALR
ncbi:MULTISPECIES: CopD family protein [Derxia]|uniref:CopD family protein n=1 Tax=Derxia gummosa DSM 723 TaxID=1121388 RepID=A0A8B6X722_9BURK|nr:MULTISPECIES: CopD family protein [Derxia]